MPRILQALGDPDSSSLVERHRHRVDDVRFAGHQFDLKAVGHGHLGNRFGRRKCRARGLVLCVRNRLGSLRDCPANGRSQRQDSSPRSAAEPSSTARRGGFVARGKLHSRDEPRGRGGRKQPPRLGRKTRGFIMNGPLRRGNRRLHRDRTRPEQIERAEAIYSLGRGDGATPTAHLSAVECRRHGLLPRPAAQNLALRTSAPWPFKSARRRRRAA